MDSEMENSALENILILLPITLRITYSFTFYT